MAMVEHTCADCEHWDMDNATWRNCPKCGSLRVTNLRDDERDYDDNEQDEYY